MNIDYDYDDDLDRRPSDWELDEWDDVGAVPLVEPLRHQSRVAAMTVWTAMAVVLALILAMGWVGWWYIGKIRPDGTETGTVAFTVNADDTVVTITQRLEEQGLIVDPEVFEWYVRQNGGLEITQGYYRIPMNETMGAVLATLRTPPGETFQQVTFPEGFTVEQMANRLAEKMPQMSAEKFIAAASVAEFDPVLLPPEGATSAEGLLFPDTYQISNADNEAQVVEKMSTNMERVAIDQADIVAGAARLNITPYQVLIIASIIEREAKLDEDRPKIARVIYNRLFIDMLLQVDATLYYGQDRSLPFSQLKAIDTPYNTYLYSGLPPTPISNPGKASILAALNPAPNPPVGDAICKDLPDPTKCLYLFYVIATPEGGHVFAATSEQQEANIEIARAAGLL